MSVYFVHTDYVYDSYQDWFTLARVSGYPVISMSEMDIDSDNVYIVTPLSGEWEKRWDHPVKAHIILWDGEWRLKESDYAWSESDLSTPPFVSRVWASDKWYAERIGAQYVPIGSHAGLVGTAVTEDRFDLAPLSYRTNRRNAAFGQMQDMGLTLAPNSWGGGRDAVIKASSAVIHVHQHDRIPTVAPLRYALAAAYHKPLISERVHDRGIFESAVLYADFAALPDYTALMVRRYSDVLQRKADELHDLLVIKNSFRSFIEAAL